MESLTHWLALDDIARAIDTHRALTRPQSMTKRMPSMVTDVSATANKKKHTKFEIQVDRFLLTCFFFRPTVFYRVTPGFTGFYRVLPGFAGVLAARGRENEI